MSELVRASDRDRYVAALYAPEDRRADLLALFAFNAETAGIRDRVSQALPGEIRLQWWRDVIEKQDAAGHPVAEALLHAIERHNLPRQAFQNLLDARIFDLYDDPMPTRGDLEGYCGETASALIQLSSLVLDADAAAGAAELAGHAGCAQAIAGLLRQLPLHRRRGQCYVPKDVLSAAGTSPEEFLAGDGGPGGPRAIAAMIALAREHLSAFERAAGSLPESLRLAYLPLAPAGAQLAKMQGREADMLNAAVDLSAWRKHWLIFRRATGGWG
ncbi:phytoene/squalene synthase family protein [Mesorhizobium marinum]|uniref:phytoene/squalene synthase family protein n=1 Tax=Mesorhizobium marinum TaxID=3228790 RepID=UPI003466A3D4